jgi:hypothetical protein
VADEIPAGGTAAPDAAATAEAEYKRELAERVKRGVEEMGISIEEKKPEPEEKPEEEKPAEEAGDDNPDDDPDYADRDEEEDGEEKPEEKGKYSKAFRQLQKRESEIQQLKSQVLQQQREIQTRESKLQQGERELGDFIKQLQLDPFNTLLKAGLLNEDDAEYASKQLYYNSKAAAADPKSKLEAERLRRERAMLMEAQQTRAEVERLKREREQERAEQQKQATLNNYVAKIDATVESYKSKTPLLAQALEKDAARTRRELFEIANELSAAKQEFADPGLVVLAWTKQRKALLAAHGLKEPVATSKKPNPNPPTSEKANPGKSSKPAQPATDDAEAREAAFQKELRARLSGTYEGD